MTACPLRRCVPLLGLLLLALALAGCESGNLSLLNEVKRFEPEWMNLSERITFIDRNLDLTERRYEADLAALNEQANQSEVEARSRLSGLRSQYRNMMGERDEIKVTFAELQTRFREQREAFNQWENRLMQGKVEEGEARGTFMLFQQQYDQLMEEADALQAQLIRNIEQHNSLVKQFTRELGVYSNYTIDPV